MKHNVLLLFVCTFVLLCRCAWGEITDPFNNTDYLTAALNSSVAADGTARMTITGAGESVVNWRQLQLYYVRLRNYNDRVEVEPASPIGAGQYSLYIRLYNSSKQFLAEIPWATARSDCTTQVLESVSRLAVLNQIQNVEYYWIKFRLHGSTGEGFEFDEIRAMNGPGYWPPTQLMQSAPKAVFGHMMTSFRTPAYSGGWYDSWNTSGHNPAILDPNGRPDIASTDYPLVGYYDMKDPKLIEYHCQCLKMACMDGAIFDVGFYTDDRDPAGMMASYFEALSDYGLKAVVCFEDKVYWKWGDPNLNRQQILQLTYDDMNQWNAKFLAGGAQYYVTDARPLFLLYSEENEHDVPEDANYLLSNEIETWLDTFDPNHRPILMRQKFYNPEHVGILNGRYTWPDFYAVTPGTIGDYVAFCDLEGNRDFLYGYREDGQYWISHALADFHISSVWPGFDDKAVWGWGKGPRLMPRVDGQLYQQTWQWAIEDDLPVVQVATWNDWFEETIIEPSVKYGGAYLEMTSQMASEFKHLPNWSVPDFNVPVWIYRIRDITSDPLVLEDLSWASECIKSDNFSQARTLVAPWAAYFNVDSVIYWTGPGSIQTAPAIQVPSNYSFGDVEYGNFVAAILQVKNAGTQPLQFTGTNPVQFVSGQEHFTIAPTFSTEDLHVTRSRDLSILFSPQGVGLHSGILQIATNDPIVPVKYIPIEGGSVFKEGDWNQDGNVDMDDLNCLSQCWLDTCGLSELLLLAEKWLD